MESLLPIGRFSRLTGLTVKALRHYDEVGLLRPAAVDPETGYRQYAPRQLVRAEAIRQLRRLELPLGRKRLTARHIGASESTCSTARGR